MTQSRTDVTRKQPLLFLMPSIDDDLAALAQTPGTKVVFIGEQLLLFARGHERMVRVENGAVFIECSAGKAAEFGLIPERSKS